MDDGYEVNNSLNARLEDFFLRISSYQFESLSNQSPAHDQFC